MRRSKSGKAESETSKKSKVARAKAISNSKPDWEGIRYFKPREFTCKCEDFCDHPPAISLELVAKLDRVRDMIKMPIRINSGTRCERHNRKVGGSSHSAHLPKNGMSHAADIHCPSAAFRYALLSAALPLFNRIGIGKDFIHVDDDPELPSDTVWVC